MLLASPAEPQSNRKLAWLAIAIAAYVAVLLLPTPAGLSASGQVALGLLVLVVILWISECVSPAASAVLLIAAAVLGLMGKPLQTGGAPMRSAEALSVMLAGFSSSAVILVAGALQNLISLNFMQGAFGETVTWGQWFVTALPLTLPMSVVLFLVSLVLLRPQVPPAEEAKGRLAAEVAGLGPVTPAELRLMVVAGLLLIMWSTEGSLHPLDTTTVTLVGIALLLMPRIGVMTWAGAEKQVPWGTITLFAAGIALGILLARTGAAGWLAGVTLGQLGLGTRSVVAVVGALSLFSIVLHLGFASATGLASTLIPIMIAFAQTLPFSAQTIFGIVMIQSFVVSFGFVLPTNAPQNMLCYGTGAFTTLEFAKVGIVLTVAGLGLILLLSATIWPMMGVL